ncbi:hypothetical protein CBR_g40442 [Chara braunii]|uniref:Integrase catalytic domain-containing protein n=1 Tax=Chara braunii TaxID=69332 RepID=A0A388LU02_CHABU|nr:hypothetical protein CBR_g40442 [Chara braunii]|eukprot:GBG85713.1 hypothetical protein CBR_g40442 [Chara braunii]
MVPFSGPSTSAGPPSFPVTQGQFTTQPPPSQQASQASVAGGGGQGQGGHGNGGQGQGGRGGGERGRNGGGRGGRWSSQGGQGQGDQGSQQGGQGYGRPRFDWRNTTCWHCGVVGHTIRFCQQRWDDELAGLISSCMDGDIYDKWGEHIDPRTPGGIRQEALKRAAAGPSAAPAIFRMWQEREDPAIRVEEIMGDSEEVTQRLKVGAIKEEPIIVESDDEEREDEGEPAITTLEKMEDLMEKIRRYQRKLKELCNEVQGWRVDLPKVFLYETGPGPAAGQQSSPGAAMVGSGPRSGMMFIPPTPHGRAPQATQTRSQSKADPSQPPRQAPSQAPPRKRPEPERRKEVVEVKEEEEEDDDTEDERLRQEEDRRTEQRAQRKEAQERVEPGTQDGVPRKRKYTVRLEEDFDVERMVDRLLEGHNNLMNIKDILASAPRLREELKGRLSRRRYKTVDKKCRHVPVLVTEDEEAYYERERGLIRRMQEQALKDPCRINDGNEEKLIVGEPGFLSPRERMLMVQLMKKRHRAYAFNNDQRERLEVDKIPMIRIHTVPHEPWNLRGARYPNPDEEKMVVDYLHGKMCTHVAGYSSGLYASPWFCFIKPNGTLRWVQDLQRLNAVTVRDAGGLPNADALSESCAGRPIISLIDLYSGYDQFPVYPPDRPVTAMHTPRGLIHMNVAPQGWTNAVAMVQRHMIRVMQTVSPHITQPYIDDLAVKGPKKKEEDEVQPGVRRFVWRHIQDLDRVLGLLEEYNLTASGPKSKHSMREATILGFVCNEKGRKPDVKKTDKILEWPVPFQTITDIEEHEQLMGGMYLLTNKLLQGDFDRRGSFSHKENEILIPENQDDEFEEGEIKEAFWAEEYDGIYLELGLLLSCEMRDRDASDKAQKMRHLYVVRDGHLLIKRQVGNPKRIVCGRNRQLDIIAVLHDGIAGGHIGISATCTKISELYHWDGTLTMVIKYCQFCVPCQERSAQRPGEPLQPRLEREVGVVVHLDLLFMLVGENGCNYIFDARDNLTGFVDGRAIRTKTRPVLANCIEEYYLRYPFVKEFMMDRGSEFTCNEVRTLLAGYGVVANYTTTAHPQANTPVERGHSTITNLLAKWTEGKPGQWPKFLRAAFFVENVTMKKTTKYAPATLWYGRHATFPIESFMKRWRRQDLEVNLSFEELLDIRARQVGEAEERLREAASQVERSRMEDKMRWDQMARVRKEPLAVGDNVLLYDSSLEKQWSRKLGKRWLGPYKIMRCGEFGAYQIEELKGTEWKDWVSGTRLKKSDFLKATMQRGGQGTRPRQRPLGASGGEERHGPFRREPTPVFDDNNIVLFLDAYREHAAQRGWDVPERREGGQAGPARARESFPACGLRQVEFHQVTEGDLLGPSPQASEQRESEVPAAPFRSLEAHLDASQWEAPSAGESPTDPSGGGQTRPEPLRLKGVGAEDVIVVEGDTPPDSRARAQTRWSWPEGIPKPDSQDAPVPPPEATMSPRQEVEAKGPGEGWRTEPRLVVDSRLAAHAAKHPDIEGPSLVGPSSGPARTELEESSQVATEGVAEASPGEEPGEAAQAKRVRVRARLAEIHERRDRMEAAGIAPRPPVAPKTSEQRIDELRARYEGRREAARQRARETGQVIEGADEVIEVGELGFAATRKAVEWVDKEIKQTSIEAFQRYSLLSDELALRKNEVEQLTAQLAEERAENKARQTRLEAKEAEWEAKLNEMAAAVERLAATKVFLDPAEAEARKEANKGSFEFKAPTELASQQEGPTSAETPKEALTQEPQPAPEEEGEAEESLTILLEVQEGTLTRAVEPPQLEAQGEESSRLDELIATMEVDTPPERPQGLETPEHDPKLEELRVQLGSWATETDSGGPTTDQRQQEATSQPTRVATP